jgi:N-acetylneuraminic acid mutarotase
MQIYNGSKWETSTIELNKERYQASAIVYQDKIYIFGGKGIEDELLESYEIFDGTQWSLGSLNLPAGRSLLNTAIINLNV